MLFTLTRHIEAPREKVFEYAADLRKAPERIRGITKLDVLTDGPIGVGTRFRETRVIMKREATEEMEITAFDAPNGYQVDCENHGCKYRTVYRLTPNGTGTELEMTFDAEPQTRMAKLLSFVFKPMMKSCMKETGKDLDDLKAAIEASD